MSNNGRVQITRLSTGVPGLDMVLGGGLPEYSFNMIAGSPGTGKTTLAQQIMFHLASTQRKALYFTVLGEPPLKMLRYQQQYSFFDHAKLDSIVEFVNLGDIVLERDLGHALDAIAEHVQRTSPGVVVVDSFRTVVRVATRLETGELALQSFLQRLALYLTSWQATTFLVGEYVEDELRDNAVFTVADGIIWLSQNPERNSVVRKLRVLKMRGQATMPGLHTFRITTDGVQVFPRLLRPSVAKKAEEAWPRKRLASGVPGLDEMMGGGLPTGDSVLVAGPSGVGKTVLSTHFIAQGAKNAEPGLIAVFEEHPGGYLKRAQSLGFDLEGMVARGQLKVIYLRPLDLSVEEALLEIRESAEAIGAKRVVIDSLSGFELALAPTFRDDFRESMYRLVGALTGIGITVLMTVEVPESFDDLKFSPHAISFLADDIILQRYMEMDGKLQRWLTVVKMRASGHSKDMREYEITGKGMVVGEALAAYRGIVTGVPEPRSPERRRAYPGLTDQETEVLQALAKLGEGTAEAVATAAGLKRAELAPLLERLVALNYVVAVAEKGKTLYRPAVRPLGV